MYPILNDINAVEINVNEYVEQKHQMVNFLKEEDHWIETQVDSNFLIIQ